MSLSRTLKRKRARYVQDRLNKMPPHIRAAVLAALHDLKASPLVGRVVVVDVQQLEGRKVVTVNILYELVNGAVHVFAGLLPLEDGVFVEAFSDSYTAHITAHVGGIIKNLADKGITVKAAHKSIEL